MSFHDEADRAAFEAAGDVFQWLEQTKRVEERAALISATVLPAVLSDMLHCIYEALECSRKGKLTISFMLLRKPIQESLFLFEAMVVDRDDFAAKLAAEPLSLRGQKAGGLEAHTRRIQAVLNATNEDRRFNAPYLAQLRYDKFADDGFDASCNKAMHLFTEHRAIRTEDMNINFVFSGLEAKLTQWSFLYSRLPYLLLYSYSVVERVFAAVAPTTPDYLLNMQRRTAALVFLWSGTIEPRYAAQPIQHAVSKTIEWLVEHCAQAGLPLPTRADLEQMAETGELPSL